MTQAVPRLGIREAKRSNWSLLFIQTVILVLDDSVVLNEKREPAVVVLNERG